MSYFKYSQGGYVIVPEGSQQHEVNFPDATSIDDIQPKTEVPAEKLKEYFTSMVDYSPSSKPQPMHTAQHRQPSFLYADGVSRAQQQPDLLTMYRERRARNIHGSFSNGWIIKNHLEQVHPHQELLHHSPRWADPVREYSHTSSAPVPVPAEPEAKKTIIPRPINCFIVFSKEKRSIFAKENPLLSNTQISTLLKKAWASMDLDEKQTYRDEAQRIKEEITKMKEADPNISFEPYRKSATSKKRKAEEQNVTSSKIFKILEDTTNKRELPVHMDRSQIMSAQPLQVHYQNHEEAGSYHQLEYQMHNPYYPLHHQFFPQIQHFLPSVPSSQPNMFTNHSSEYLVDSTSFIHQSNVSQSPMYSTIPLLDEASPSIPKPLPVSSSSSSHNNNIANIPILDITDITNAYFANEF